MPIENIEIAPVAEDKATLTVTLRGDAEELVQALVHGLPPEAVQQLAAALTRELEARRKTVDAPA